VEGVFRKPVFINKGVYAEPPTYLIGRNPGDAVFQLPFWQGQGKPRRAIHGTREGLKDTLRELACVVTLDGGVTRNSDIGGPD